MKKLLLALITFVCFESVNAQFIKRMTDRAKNKIEQKAGEKVDKGIDDAVDGKKKEKKKTESTDDANSEKKADEPESKGTTSSAGSTGTEKAGAPEGDPALATYSKYDFVPGDKVIAFEDFADTEIGDFPLKWNTNGTAEVVKVNSREGKWLKLTKKAGFHPEFITALPDNFTLEFDLGVNDDWNSYPFAINMVKLKNADDYLNYGYYVGWQGEPVVHLDFKPAVVDSRSEANSTLHAGKDGNGIRNNVNFTSWNNKDNKFAHVAIWRQKQRLRVYVNGDKIWDIPRAFDATEAYNAVTMGITDEYRAGDLFLFSNLRLASGAPDTRNKLITEGKFVTRGILFDVNSDAIKPESYGTIKDIATVLKDNGTVRVKVIGHTDSDGETSTNLDLSKRRAAAVKTALTSEFGIDESRIETDGKGESQPVDKSETAVGKANNRRVEFIKL